jgi:hypothetical protein
MCNRLERDKANLVWLLVLVLALLFDSGYCLIEKMEYVEGTLESEITENFSDQEVDTFGPDRLRKGETVLRARTSRILLVLEQCHDSFNHQVRSPSGVSLTVCTRLESSPA